MSASDHLSLVQFKPVIDAGLAEHIASTHAVPDAQMRAEAGHAMLHGDDYHTLLHETDEGYGVQWILGARPHDHHA